MSRSHPTVACLLWLATVAGCAAEGDEPFAGEGAAGGGGKADSGAYALTVVRDTFLKRTTAQSSELEWGSGKCRLYAGAEITSRIAPRRTGNHLAIDLATYIPGCELSVGYVFAEHVAIDGGSDDPGSGGGGPCYANITVRECALLSTIAYAEGTGDRYDLIFSYQTFFGYADHPRRVVCSGGYCSDAAGRYQFLSTTWDWAASRAGVRDFTPASQDRAALWLIANRGVTWIDRIDTYAELEDALYRLNTEWASLPGSPYGQPTHSASTLWSVYRSYAGL